MQLVAAFFIDSIRKLLEENKDWTPKVNNLLRWIAEFHVDASFPIQNHREVEPLLAVAHNLLIRGLPTRPSVWVEDTIAERFNQFGKREDTKLGHIVYNWDQASVLRDEIFQALHLIEPRLKRTDKLLDYRPSWEKLASWAEDEFFYEEVPSQLGTFFAQLLEIQRDLSSIVSDDTYKFRDQRVDFSHEIPYLTKLGAKIGFVLEVDGSQHWLDANQKKLDAKRDEALRNSQWFPIRIRTNEFNKIATTLYPLKRSIDTKEYFQILANNYDNPLHERNLGALELALSPVVVARIQKVLLEYLIHKAASQETVKTIKLAIIERDVAGSWLAVEDLQKNLQRLVDLRDPADGTYSVPKIELHIFISQEFSHSHLNRGRAEVKLITEINPNYMYDLAIDVAILQRPGYTTVHEYNLLATHSATIRSVHHLEANQKFYTTRLIKYQPLIQLKPDSSDRENKRTIDTLTYFIQDLFRIKEFRQGQVGIIHRALRQENVIGLLPTGGGKSLTYQIAALLQPGICLVIDPIKSLMKDQYDSLVKRHRIDGCIYINSSLKGPRRIEMVERFQSGQALFAFVSPERLQITGFRELLSGMAHNHVYFSYCIVDEAHCVSEWGHDFRTSYLRLGLNVRRNCKVAGAKKADLLAEYVPSIPIMALTATASFDVLSDVQRELNLTGDDDAIVREDYQEREELQFIIREVNIDGFLKPTTETDFWDIKKKIGHAKQQAVVNLVEEFLETKTDTGLLVFCPHRGWIFGVSDDNGKGMADVLRAKFPKEQEQIGTYKGADEQLRAAELAKHENENEENQTAFLENRSRVMIATKAFGMGIDKPNISTTIHLNMPSSLEGFVQESGRAGRDKTKSDCYILLNTQPFTHKAYQQKETPDGWKTEYAEVGPGLPNTLDIQLNREFHTRNFKGQLNEQWVIAELLTEIRFPNEKALERIVTLIEQETDLPGINSWLGTTHEVVFFKHQDITLGFVNLTSNSRVLQAPLSYKTTFDAIVDQFQAILSEQDLSGQDPFTWLKTHVFSQEPEPGIERVLNRLEIGDTENVIIPFKNDGPPRIQRHFISKGLRKPIAEIKTALDQTNDFDSFIVQLKALPVYKSDQELEGIYYGVRNQGDTIRAIHRLSIVGVIADYTIDYNAQTICATVRKLSDEALIQNLENYLKKHISIESAEKEGRRILDRQTDTVLWDCQIAMIDFFYQNIVTTRFNGINTMYDACLVGLNEESNEFKKFVDLYFNSKYFNPKEKKNFHKDDLLNRRFDFNLVKCYIHEIKDKRDLWKHLRGACARFSEINKEMNSSLLLMEAYVLFLLEGKRAAYRNRAFTQTRQGFYQLFLHYQQDQQIEQDYQDRLTEDISYFVEKLYDQDRNLKKTIQKDDFIETILLSVQTQWLADFTKKQQEEYHESAII